VACALSAENSAETGASCSLSPSLFPYFTTLNSFKMNSEWIGFILLISLLGKLAYTQRGYSIQKHKIKIQIQI
jgi:hypothetical protein